MYIDVTIDVCFIHLYLYILNILMLAAHLPMRQWKYASRVPTEAWLEGGMPKSRRDVTEPFSTQAPKVLPSLLMSGVVSMSPVQSPVLSPVFHFSSPAPSHTEPVQVQEQQFFPIGAAMSTPF